MPLPEVPWVWRWSFLLLQSLLLSTAWSGGVIEVDGASLPVLKIGALLGINSSIGKVALAAIQLAVQDVNINTSILPDYQLSLEALDSACDAFQGAASGSACICPNSKYPTPVFQHSPTAVNSRAWLLLLAILAF